MSVHACYPGSFDPVTHGHLDVIRRAASLFDRVVVAVGTNASKAALFKPDQRVEFLRAELGDLRGKVDVEVFTGMVVDFCRARKITVLVRGVRFVSDFETEFQMARANRSFAPEIDTVILLPDERYAHVSSRLIKEIVLAGGDAGAFVPQRVAEALRARLALP